MCPELVNFPNTIPLYLVIDGEKADLDKSGIISHNRSIDLKNGVIYRETVFKNGVKETSFKSARFVCRHDRNSAVMVCEVTPLNWSGEIKIVSELDGTVHNAFANYFPEEWARHVWLESINDSYDPDTVMVVRTRDLDVKYCFATYLSIDRPFDEVRRF
jgi:trehalose/maltose hydrolase-like predicted phosphorylase